MRKPKAATPTRATRRCAIYTRKSSEEGLELRIPMKPAMHSDFIPATHSETKPATFPI